MQRLQFCSEGKTRRKTRRAVGLRRPPPPPPQRARDASGALGGCAWCVVVAVVAGAKTRGGGGHRKPRPRQRGARKKNVGDEVLRTRLGEAQTPHAPRACGPPLTPLHHPSTPHRPKTKRERNGGGARVQPPPEPASPPPPRRLPPVHPGVCPSSSSSSSCTHRLHHHGARTKKRRRPGSAAHGGRGPGKRCARGGSSKPLLTPVHLTRFFFPQPTRR